MTVIVKLRCPGPLHRGISVEYRYFFFPVNVDKDKRDWHCCPLNRGCPLN